MTKIIFPASQPQTPDPVLAEVRRIKVELLEKFHYDMVAVARDARNHQSRSGHPIITKEPTM